MRYSYFYIHITTLEAFLLGIGALALVLAIVSITSQIKRKIVKKKERNNQLKYLYNLDSEIEVCKEPLLDDAINELYLLNGNMIFNDQELDEMRNKVVFNLVRNKKYLDLVKNTINNFLDKFE